jgi:hypothetical protein
MRSQKSPSFSGAPGADLLGGGEADLDRVEVVDVDQSESLCVA